MYDLAIENSYFGRYATVGGIDEAGRGPLAGPVVAACVVVERGFVVPEGLLSVKDSKQLSAKARQTLDERIRALLPGVGIGACDHATIDRINILEAAFLAMKKALSALRRKPELVLVDGKFIIPNLSLAQQAIVGGDAQSFAIAAASIVAKAARDRLMAEAHTLYPAYGFDRHKGYGTSDHLENLRNFGPCPIHRRSFAPVRRLLRVET
jgi:ribonuclease HII